MLQGKDIDNCASAGCCMFLMGCCAIGSMALIIIIVGAMLVNGGSVLVQNPYVSGILVLCFGLGLPVVIAIILLLIFCCKK